ncbi:MAG: OmpA family protein [Gemmatimonadaceae bacterium]|nr:OmpA family protein [Gemmatimonadaceae bacterium]
MLAVAACAQPKPEPISARSDIKRPEVPPPEVGQERVHFEPNATHWAASERVVIESVVQRLRADPLLDLQISGHTDSTEPDADGLSHARALAVQSKLGEYGIPQRRLLIRAVGAKEPRDNNTTDAGRANNRRVEFVKVTVTVSAIGRVVVTDTQVEILDPVTFERGKVSFTPTSRPALDAIASTLHGNPSILLVEVQSHTDERGDDEANLRLTQARAKIVVNYLIAKGIDPARLDPQGYGETQPIDNGHNEAAWAKNTRIELVIIKRAP